VERPAGAELTGLRGRYNLAFDHREADVSGEHVVGLVQRAGEHQFSVEADARGLQGDRRQSLGLVDGRDLTTGPEHLGEGLDHADGILITGR
jgi:hypothetical protein